MAKANKYSVTLEDGRIETVEAYTASDAAAQAAVKWSMSVIEVKPAIDESADKNKQLLFS